MEYGIARFLMQPLPPSSDDEPMLEYIHYKRVELFVIVVCFFFVVFSELNEPRVTINLGDGNNTEKQNIFQRFRRKYCS